MDARYIAFISYRHKSNDMAAAKKLHRMIEHYRVPKGIEGIPSRQLGRVFRDQDELPVSNNLTENITAALDNAQFLIVICTPDTPGSIWVQREIAYFMERHGREHVLAVLVSGTPEESFPRLLTEIYEEDGVTVREQVEPLAANIVGKDLQPDFRKLRQEAVRLYAALLGCPYDKLWQRERRYRRRRELIAAGAVGAVALSFITVLLVNNVRIKQKNRQISAQSEEIRQQNEEISRQSQALIQKNGELERQIRDTQRRESEALAVQSGNLLAGGDRPGAVRAALDALPFADPARPYVAQAEKALADALYLYQPSYTRFDAVIQNPTPVYDFAVSQDGGYILTADIGRQLRAYDASGRQLWTASPGGDTGGRQIIQFLETKNAFLYTDGTKHYLLAAEDGTLLWQNPPGNDAFYLTEDESLAAAACTGAQDWELRLFRTEDGVLEKTIPLLPLEPAGDTPFLLEFAGSPDSRMAALSAVVRQEDGKQFELTWLCDLEAGTAALVSREEALGFELYPRTIAFTEDGELLLSMAEPEEGAVRVGLSRFDRTGNLVFRGEMASVPLENLTAYNTAALLVDGETAMYIMHNNLLFFRTDTGAFTGFRQLSGVCLAAERLGPDLLGLVLENGIFTLVKPGERVMSLDGGSQIECGFPLYDASVSRTGTGNHLVLLPERNRSRLVTLNRTAGQCLAEGLAVEGGGGYAVSPSGGRYFLLSRQGMGRVLAADTLDELGSVPFDKTAGSGVVCGFSANGETVCAGGNGCLERWNWRSGEHTAETGWDGFARLTGGGILAAGWKTGKSDPILRWSVDGADPAETVCPWPCSVLRTWVLENGVIAAAAGEETGLSDGLVLYDTIQNLWHSIQWEQPADPDKLNWALLPEQGELAVLDEAGELFVYALESGRLARRLSTGLEEAPGPIHPCMAGRGILTSSHGQGLLLYSTETGALLWQDGERDYTWVDLEELKVWDLPEEDLIILSLWDGLFLDADQLIPRAVCPGMVDYDPASATLVQRDGDSINLYRRLRLDELMALGNDFLN